MTLFHVVEVHGIDDRSGGRRADFPDCTAESVAGAEGGNSEALAFPCVIGQRRGDGQKKRGDVP